MADGSMANGIIAIGSFFVVGGLITSFTAGGVVGFLICKYVCK